MVRKFWESGNSQPFTPNQELVSREQYPFVSNGRQRRAYMDMAGDITRRALEEMVPPSSTTLDVGCGDGIDIINLHQIGHYGHKIGLEQPVEGNPDATIRKFTYLMDNLQRHGVNQAEILMGDMHEIPLEDNSVDIVIAAAVLQHARNLKRVLKEFRRVARNNGSLIIVTNFFDNKPVHHKELQIAVKQIGGRVQPLSRPFHFEKALQVMDSQPGYEYVQDFVQGLNGNNLALRTDEEIATIMLSASTYRQSIKPILNKHWNEERKQSEMEKFEMRVNNMWWPLMQQMVDRLTAIRNRDGVVYETIKRGVIEYRIVK